MRPLSGVCSPARPRHRCAWTPAPSAVPRAVWVKRRKTCVSSRPSGPSWARPWPQRRGKEFFWASRMYKTPCLVSTVVAGNWSSSPQRALHSSPTFPPGPSSTVVPGQSIVCLSSFANLLSGRVRFRLAIGPSEIIPTPPPDCAAGHTIELSPLNLVDQ
ncbi:hypothetical protein BDY21DRAFT_80391 [Lineolata rhizophorae]|uniref:Uncharacterized protein n=1 Tax=Lineolata rhizophorae TaxID=578093 RepID=A0A6A6NTR0_9PEZI|nr:hypothetical protein BDY21DRAFT_80391 [Lineolata rhizophorae]